MWKYVEEIMWGYYDKFTNNFLKKAKGYALKKVVKSDYLKETTSILPLTFLTIATRGAFNFLITSRLKTGFYLFDTFFSLLITVFFTLSSPFLYNLFNKTLKDEVDGFSKFIIDSFWLEGWNFFEYWKVRIFGTLGIFLIFLLFFIEINSRMIQEFILHTLISSAIVDYITKMQMEKIETPKVRVLSSPQMIESYYPIKKEINNNVNNINDVNNINCLIIDNYKEHT